MASVLKLYCDCCCKQFKHLTVYWQCTDAARRSTEAHVNKLELCDSCLESSQKEFSDKFKFKRPPADGP